MLFTVPEFPETEPCLYLHAPPSALSAFQHCAVALLDRLRTQVLPGSSSKIFRPRVDDTHHKRFSTPDSFCYLVHLEMRFMTEGREPVPFLSATPGKTNSDLLKEGVDRALREGFSEFQLLFCNYCFGVLSFTPYPFVHSFPSSSCL